MYDNAGWSEYYEYAEIDPDDTEAEEYPHDARWQSGGEYERFYSQEPALPLHSLPDFTLPVGIAAAIFIVFVLTRGSLGSGAVLPLIEAASGRVAVETSVSIETDDSTESIAPQGISALTAEQPDPNAFAAPYADYVITQGIHGASYGQMAIDLAAGKGEPVLSPINGVVTENYTDQYGNPTIVIENERYVVKMLHGIFSAGVGETVVLGQQVGEESNLGYTTDMRGVPCWQKTGYCGYHTHLNVFDRELNANVNPLDLISP